MAWGTFQPDNGVAMCYHSESARQWMRDIVDLCVKEVARKALASSPAIWALLLHAMRRLSDTEYHSRVIDETAEYIKLQHPKQILGLSAWGVDLAPEQARCSS